MLYYYVPFLPRCAVPVTCACTPPPVLVVARNYLRLCLPRHLSTCTCTKRGTSLTLIGPACVRPPVKFFCAFLAINDADARFQNFAMGATLAVGPAPAPTHG